MSKDKLNIIVPVYNPHPGWETHFLQHLHDLETKIGETDFRVVLVNDGSTKVIENIDVILKSFPRLDYFSYPVNKGKGHAIRYGIAQEVADYYFYTDVDFPFGCDVIAEAYDKLKNTGVNLVIGVRNKEYFHALPPERRIISYLMKGFCKAISRSRLRDTQAPLKGFDNRARDIFLNTKVDGFIFDFEFLLKCLRHKITYTNIKLSPRPGLIFTEFSNSTIRKEFINLLRAVF